MFYFMSIDMYLELCPSGKALYREPASKAPIRCTISSNSNQVNNFVFSHKKTKKLVSKWLLLSIRCSRSLPRLLLFGQCPLSKQGKKIPPYWTFFPFKAEFYLEEKTQMPRSCTMGSFITCPTGYSLFIFFRKSNLL